MSGGNVENFLKKSLKKLDLDYVDLYLIHLPVGVKVNFLKIMKLLVKRCTVCDIDL